MSDHKPSDIISVHCHQESKAFLFSLFFSLRIKSGDEQESTLIGALIAEQK